MECAVKLITIGVLFYSNIKQDKTKKQIDHFVLIKSDIGGVVERGSL